MVSLARALIAGIVVCSIALFGGNIATHLGLWSRSAPSSSGIVDPSPAPSSAPMEGKSYRIAVIGGGLAGLAAAIEAHEAAASAGLPTEILLVEKEANLGGNSAKASSGMNALNEAGGDSIPLFKEDTLSSGGGLCDTALVDLLVGQSPQALAFITGTGLDLSKITQLGGHSAPRSWSNPVGPNVGRAIMLALIKKVQQMPGIKVMEKTKLTGIAMKDGRVSGVRIAPSSGAGEAAAEAERTIACDAVIMATGGFGANRALLQKHRPAAAALATTNGAWAQGEGLEIAEAAGAELIHLEHVQIHPTGFVDPKDPESGTKWLAPEKFRGTGALLINTEGKRFVDELSTRDKVSDAIFEQPGQKAFLLLGYDSAVDFGIKTVEFYGTTGMMNKAENVAEAAEKMGVPAEELVRQVEAYNAGAKSRSDAFGKTVFPHLIQPDAPCYWGLIVPVVHYTMGGIKIDGRAQALDASGRAIPGLYAAGEVSAGVHGANRLGGNSLLECAVFGRIAGKEAVSFLSR